MFREMIGTMLYKCNILHYLHLLPITYYIYNLYYKLCSLPEDGQEL